MSYTKNIVASLIVSLLLVGCDRQQTNALQEQAETVISKHTIRFTEPPKRIPNRNSVDAPLSVSYTHLRAHET